MKKSLAISMLLIGVATMGCASNLHQSFSPDDAIKVPNVEPSGTRVADHEGAATQDPAAPVSTNMKAAMLVVGLSEMSRLVDSARGQSN